MTARLALLALVLGAAEIAGVLAGGSRLAPGDVVAALFHPRTASDAGTIVWALRVPRLCIAAVVGASLAIAGALLQGMLRNPLVDPYLTGVSAGAAAAIAIAISFGVAAPLLPALGFAAGLGTAAIVAALARRGGGLDAERLILAGVSLSAFFAALMALILTRQEAGGAAQAIVAWLAGSVAGRGWHELGWASIYAVGGLVVAAALVPSLNALRLGEVRAAAVGVDVPRTQWTLLAAASLLTASAVALAGILGFVGLIVPHIARRIVGTDARVLFVACALLGAALVIAADALSRALFPPLEIPLGVLLAFVGVPTFLYLYLYRPNARRWNA